MEENKRDCWHIILHYFNKGINATEMQKKKRKKDLHHLWRRCCGWSNVSKWFVKFHAGCFALDDVPQLGGPVEVDGDQIETLIESNQHYTTQEIANILKISKSIKLLVKMKNVSLILRKINHMNVLTNPIYSLRYKSLSTVCDL